jgi:lysozyme family protein
MSFERAIEFTLKWEGGETVDTGGYTKFGISQKAYPYLDIKNLTLEQAKEIYKRDYWNQIKGDELPQRIALVVFDTAVNVGVKRASRLLQETLNRYFHKNLVTDGIIGRKTIETVRSVNEKELVEKYLVERATFYSRLPEHYNTYKRGWLNRVFDLYREAMV